MLEQMKKIICEYVSAEPDDITADSRFVEDLGFNSYDFMCMVGEVEEVFSVEVEEKDILKIKTVGDALEYVKTLQEK